MKASIRPATVNLEPGAVVPMPMLPFDSMTIESPIVSGLVHFVSWPGVPLPLTGLVLGWLRLHTR